MGIPFQCGDKGDAARHRPEVVCHVEAKVSIPSKVASFLHLSSRVLAHGVASDPRDKFTTSSDQTVRDRTYFLAIPAR